MAYDQLALTVTYTMFPMQFATAWGGLPALHIPKSQEESDPQVVTM